MIRLYIENIQNIMMLSSDHKHYLKNVMRCNDGDTIYVFDNEKEYVAKISFPNILIVRENATRIDSKLRLGISYIRKSRLEWAIEKSTELGVDEIYLLISERTNRKNVDNRRLKRIAIEAAEQCGRIGIPKIYESVKLKDLPDLNWVVADTNEKSNKKLWHGDGILVGPEGGWSDNEMCMLEKYQKISLHLNILRTETAACAGLALFGGEKLF